MSVLTYTKPDPETERAVRDLERVCNEADGLFGTLYLDPSLNISPDLPCLFTATENGVLAAALALFAPTREEAELFGMTHPDFRRKGLFRSLVRVAAGAAQSFGIRDLVPMTERQSASGGAAVSSLGAALDFTEYRMHYDPAATPQRFSVPDGLTLRIATADDLNDMASVAAASYQEPAEQARHFLALSLEATQRSQYVAHLNGVPAGIGAIGRENGEATIFGIAVSPGLQNGGVGRGIISLLVRDLLGQKQDRILLEVDSKNEPALHLYRTCGFVAEATNDYYRAPLERVLERLNRNTTRENGIMIRYAHTNLIAKDPGLLIDFYEKALGCKRVGETRDLSGEWLDRLTGIPNAHIFGEHLVLPGYEERHPTLEVFSYDTVQNGAAGVLSAAGFAHIAFEVDDVPAALERVLACGGGTIGELVRETYADGRTLSAVYASDPEGNILELQNWS